jgi:flagellum-specific peptidoglycan hydrolase FlgJ
MYNLKKYTQKDRYGNTITFEVERMQEATVPSMQEIPMYDHPGEPKGTDTVPAWLTPGEFVMNAEATRMYEPQIKAMNDHGRAVQKAQGGTIPQYASDGGWISNLFLSDDVKDAVASAQAPNQYQQSRTAEILRDAPPAKPYMDPEGAREREIAAENARAAAEKIAPNIPVVGPMADYLIQRRKHYEQMEDILHRSGGGDVPYSRDAYMAELIPAAKEEAERLGVDPRIIVAQSIQETGWGKKAPENAYFGIKSHGYKGKNVDFGTHEYEDGQKVNMRDSFRGYDSLSDSVRGYGDFMLANPRYKPYMEAEGLDAQLAALGKSGYATDPNYAKNLKNIIGGRTFKKYYRAEGSEEPEVPMVEEVPMPVDGIVQDMAGFEETNPNPPTPQEITMQYGTPEMTYDERRDLRDQMAMDTATSSLNNYVEVPEVENETLNPYAQEKYEKKEFAVPKPMDIPEGGDEFSSLDSSQELTEEDKRRVEEGRKRRAEEHREMLANKPSTEVTQADLDRQEQLDNAVSGKIKQEYINVDPDAPGEDMNNPDVQVLKTFADTYGEPSDEEFNKIDKQFEDLNKQEKDSSWLDSLVSKDMQASIGGFFSKMMNHALSDRALSALVMNYVGSRAMGYGHGESFQFAAKKYGKQIEASKALEDKLYLSGKYKAPSIKRAMEKGDFGELVLAKSGMKATTTFKDFYKGGKKYRAQKYKVGDNEVFYAVDPQTRQHIPIDSTFSDDDRYSKGTKGYSDRIKEARSQLSTKYKEVEDRLGIDPDAKSTDPRRFYIGLGPDSLAKEFVAWAEANGVEPDDPNALDIAANAYRQAVLAVKDGRIKRGTSSIRDFLDDQMIRESTGTQELFMINRDKFESGDEAPKYVGPVKMKAIYQKAEALASQFEGGKATKQAIFAHAVKKWGEHAKNNTKLYQKYMESGTEKSTPFYNFLEAEFDTAMKDFAAQ